MSITKLPSFTLDPWITDKSNSAADYANSAFAAANNASGGIDTWVRDAANSSSSYANSSYTLSNTNSTTITTVGSYANSAFSAANNATDSWVRDAANSSGSYANSAFSVANTNSTTITIVGGYANSAFTAANNATDSWVRDAANSSSSYANSAYEQANTLSGTTVSSTSPVSPNTGDLWFENSSIGSLFVYDGNVWISTADGAGSGSGSGLSAWQEVTSNTTATNNDRLLVNTASLITITLPSSPSLGDEVSIVDAYGNAGNNNITLARNGSNILGGTDDLVLDVDDASVIVTYYNATRGWIITKR